MNILLNKPIIAAWLVLTASSLQAWQGDGTAGGNTAESTAESTAETPLDPFSPDEPGALDKQVQTNRVVQGGSIIITWSENNDELRGFSNTLGEWEVLRIDKPDSIVPIVSDDVAAVRIGDSIAAFSGGKGWWDVIALSKDSAAQPSVSGDLVHIEDNGHLYTFAAAKGRWTSPTDPELKPATTEVGGSTMSMIQAFVPFNEWLNSMPRYKARGIRLQSTGSGSQAIHAERQSLLEEARQKLTEILHNGEATVEEHTPVQPSFGTALPDIDRRIAELRKEQQSLEANVNKGSDVANSNDGVRDSREQALRGVVEQAFDLRQQLQRLEAQRMQLKLQLIEANLDAREKNREAIIQQRVDEMLASNGKLTGPGDGEKTTPIASPELPATGTTIGLPGPAEHRYGGLGGLAPHQANNDSRFQWPQPAEIAKDLRGKMESVTNLLRNKKVNEQRGEQWSRPLEQLQSEGIATPEMTEAQRQALVDSRSRIVSSMQSQLDTVQQDWKLAWSAYQSKLRLLRLDLEEAKLALDSLTVEQNRMQQLVEKGAIPKGDLQTTESRLAVAKINVLRAEELLKLYADIEILEPTLNPDSLKSEE